MSATKISPSSPSVGAGRFAERVEDALGAAEEKIVKTVAEAIVWAENASAVSAVFRSRNIPLPGGIYKRISGK